MNPANRAPEVIPPPKDTGDSIKSTYALIDASNKLCYVIKLCQVQDGEFLAYLYQDGKIVCLFEMDKDESRLYRCIKCSTSLTYETLNFNRAHTTVMIDSKQYIMQELALLTPFWRQCGQGKTA